MKCLKTYRLDTTKPVWIKYIYQNSLKRRLYRIYGMFIQGTFAPVNSLSKNNSIKICLNAVVLDNTELYTGDILTP
jgi:hypothetical protein